MSDFLKVFNERTSAEHFDSATPISVQEIKELISEACQSPSSFNIQHWRFIAVTDERVRESLKATTIAPNQERVANAPLIFVILGDLNGHKRLEGILDETVHADLSGSSARSQLRTPRIPVSTRCALSEPGQAEPLSSFREYRAETTASR
jgi:nitroreductase